MIHSLSFYKKVFRATLSKWSADKVPRLGAALAFYSMLSIGPLLLFMFKRRGDGLWS